MSFRRHRHRRQRTCESKHVSASVLGKSWMVVMASCGLCGATLCAMDAAEEDASQDAGRAGDRRQDRTGDRRQDRTGDRVSWAGLG